MPGFFGLAEQLLVVHRPGVDAVEHAVLAVEPLRELLVHHRALGEREVLHVARQRDQHGAAGLGVDAGDGDRVRPQPPAVGAGVAAEQQHVVAAVVRAAGVAGAEHGLDEVALHADQVRAEEQHRGDREAEDAVDADRCPAVAHPQRQRLPDPPRVEEQRGPADGQRHQREPDRLQGGEVGDQPERELVVHGRHDQAADPDHQQREPDPQRGPSDRLVAARELRAAGEHQRHRHQRQRPAEPHAGGAVLGAGRRRSTTYVEPTVAWPGMSLLRGRSGVPRQYHQSQASQPGTTRRGSRIADRSVTPPLC